MTALTDKDNDPKNFEHCQSPCKFYCDKHFFECFIHCKICTTAAKNNYITDNDDDTEEIEVQEEVMELEEGQNDIALYNQTYFYSVCDEISSNEEEFEESSSSRKKAKKNTKTANHCVFLDQEAVEGDWLRYCGMTMSWNKW